MENRELLSHSKKWDRTGLFISGLCMVHCLALPILLFFSPAIDVFLGDSYFEAIILSLAILVGSISFWTSFKKHRMLQPMILGLIGVVFLGISLYTDFFTSHNHPHSYARGFFANLDPYMVLGGLMLIAGHLWNIHACHCFCDRSCDHEHHEH